MKATGGPAFPRGESAPGHTGMTLRDYFAAAALISIVRSRDKVFLEKDDATWCYGVADAMLNERAK